jgi:hypothetical protein
MTDRPPEPTSDTRSSAKLGRGVRSAAWLGLSLHGLLVVPYLLSGLLAPLWAVGVLWTVWTALLIVALGQRRKRPLLVALTPVIGLGTWIAALWAGTALLGWSP